MKAFDIIERREKVLFQGHTAFIDCFGLTCDNAQIITCSGDWTIRIWNLREKRQERVLYDNRHHMQCIGISCDDRYIVTCSYGIVTIWNLQDRRYIRL